MLLAETSIKQGMNTVHHYLLLGKENTTNYYFILTNKGLSPIASWDLSELQLLKVQHLGLSTLESPVATLSTKTFCNDRNVLCLYCPVKAATSRM